MFRPHTHTLGSVTTATKLNDTHQEELSFIDSNRDPSLSIPIGHLPGGNPKRKHSFPSYKPTPQSAGLLNSQNKTSEDPQLPPISPWLPSTQEVGLSTSQQLSLLSYSSNSSWPSDVWNHSTSRDVWADPSLPSYYTKDTWSTMSPQRPVEPSSWPQWSTTDDQLRGTAQATFDGREDLIQLLRSLDISEQHADVLLVCARECVCAHVCICVHDCVCVCVFCVHTYIQVHVTPSVCLSCLGERYFCSTSSNHA